MSDTCPITYECEDGEVVVCNRADTLSAHQTGHNGRRNDGAWIGWRTTLDERRRWERISPTTLTEDLIQMVSANWSDRNLAVSRIVKRFEAVEARQRKARMHDPGCPADHNCDRDHPMMAVAHDPLPCTCWLSEPTKEIT